MKMNDHLICADAGGARPSPLAVQGPAVSRAALPAAEAGTIGSAIRERSPAEAEGQLFVGMFGDVIDHVDRIVVVVAGHVGNGHHRLRW